MDFRRSLEQRALDEFRTAPEEERIYSSLSVTKESRICKIESSRKGWIFVGESRERRLICCWPIHVHVHVCIDIERRMAEKHCGRHENKYCAENRQSSPLFCVLAEEHGKTSLNLLRRTCSLAQVIGRSHRSAHDKTRRITILHNHGVPCK